MRKFKSGHFLCTDVKVEVEHIGTLGKKAVIFDQDEDLVSLDFDEIDDLIEFLRAEQERLR